MTLDGLLADYIVRSDGASGLVATALDWTTVHLSSVENFSGWIPAKSAMEAMAMMSSLEAGADSSLSMAATPPSHWAADGADTITDCNSGNSGALNDGDTTNNDFIDLSALYTNIFELFRSTI